MKLQFSLLSFLALIFLLACWAGTLVAPTSISSSCARFAQITVVSLAVLHVIVQGTKQCNRFVLTFAIVAVVFAVIDDNMLCLPYDVPNDAFELIHGDLIGKTEEVRHFRSGFKWIAHIVASATIASLLQLLVSARDNNHLKDDTDLESAEHSSDD